MGHIGKAFLVRARLVAGRRSTPVFFATVVSQAVAGNRERWERHHEGLSKTRVAPPVVTPVVPVRVAIAQPIERGRPTFRERLFPYRIDVPMSIIPRGPPQLVGLFQHASVGATTWASTSGYVQTSYSLGTGPLPPPFSPRRTIGVFTVARRPAHPPLFTGLIVSQAMQRPYVGRQSQRPLLLAPAVLGTPAGELYGFPGPFVASQAIPRAYIGRTTPKPHLAPPLTAPYQGGTFIYQAVRRSLYQRDAGSYVSLKPGGLPPQRPGTFAYQATQRPYVGRTVPKPHVTAPIVPPHAPPPALLITQALRRPYVGRTSQRPLLLPYLAPQPPVPRGTFVSQALQRPYVGRTSQRPFLLPPAIVGHVGPGAHIFSVAVKRAPYQRTSATYVWRIVPRKPVARGTFTSQAIPRARIRREAPPPHLVGPIVGVPPARGAVQPALFLNQALSRPYIGRTAAQPPLVAPPVLPVPSVAYVVVQNEVIQPQPWLPSLRSPLHPRYAAPVVTPRVFPPNAPGTFIYQATERTASLADRGTQGTVSRWGTLPQPLFLGLVVSQARQRAYVGRTVPLRPRVAPPVIPIARPGKYSGQFAYQAIQSALAGRGPFPPKHLAPAIVGVGPILLGTTPLSTIVSQATQRALYQRDSATYLSRKPGGIPPSRPGTFVSQAVKRALLGRGPFPAQNIAKPLVNPFVVSKPVIIGQAIQRNQERRLRDTVPRPHLAQPVAARPGPGATIKLQGQARALVRRDGRVYLPKSPPASPFRPALVVSQAVQRAYVGRTTPAPHLAPPFTKKARGATIVLQALRRPYVGRNTPAPHLPPAIIGRRPVIHGTFVTAVREDNFVKRDGHVLLPKRGAPQPVRRGTFVSQAIQRPYVGRQAGRTYIGAKPIVVQPRPPVNTIPKIVSQAIQRALLGRKVPVPPRYQPIVFVPVHPVAPQIIITRKGSTHPYERGGTTNPRPTRYGTTNPLE